MENQYEFTVTALHANLNKRLQLQILFDEIQYLNGLNSNSIGLTDELFEKKNVVWMLINDYIEFYKDMPEISDKVLVETSFGKAKGIKFYREDRVYLDSKADENLIARNASTWIVSDKETRALKRPSFVMDKKELLAKCDQSLEFPYNIENISNVTKGMDELVKVLTYKVLYSDLDVNRHMHNTNYTKLAIDSYIIYKDIDLEKHDIKIENYNIEYKKEMLINDIIDIFIAEKDDYTFIEGRMQDGEVSFVIKAKISLIEN